jgi:LysR family glycine cleavage system transcriptional activator
VHYGTGLPEGVAGEMLLGEVLLPVCNPTVAASVSARRPRDLAAGVLLHSARRPHDWPAWFSAAGVHDLKIAQEILFENSGLTVQGAIDGMGIAMAQAAFVTEEMKTGRLVSPLEFRLKTALGYYLVFPPEKLRRKKVQLFQAWVAQEAAGTRGVIG